MYSQNEFEQTGVGLWPVAGGMFSGRGNLVDLHAICQQSMPFSYDIEGMAHERVEHGDFLVHPGEIVCFWPHTWHDLTEHQGVPLRTIHFDVIGQAVPAVAAWFGMTPERLVAKPSDPAEAYVLFKEIVAGFQSDIALPPSHFLRRFFRLAELCGPGPERKARTVPETLVERAIRVCTSEMQLFPTVPELAAHLGVCQNTLLNACRRERGISAVELLRDLKLERARDLLRNTDHKLARIAAACGFRSQSHFIGCFQTATGMAPTAWREAQSADAVEPLSSSSRNG